MNLSFKNAALAAALCLVAGLAQAGGDGKDAAAAKPAGNEAKPAAAAEGAAKADAAATAPTDISKDVSKVCYVIGIRIGQQIAEQRKQISADLNRAELKFDEAAFDKGFKEALAGASHELTEPQMEQLMKEFSEGFRKVMEGATAKEGAKNAELGKKFLEENAKKEGWKSTSSGLQYKAVTEGTGPKPKASDSVEVHYRGTLIDGTQFDSSYDRNQTAKFPLGGVIPGWTEGLQLMSVGSKYEFVIPSNLAYGEQGRPSIPPNSVLLFTVELISIAEGAPEQPVGAGK